MERMGITLPAFTPIQDSLWVTLCGRALARRLPNPILTDTIGDEILRKLDYDCDKLHIDRSTIVTVAHRAKKLDEVAQNYISRHPDAVGLDLGAGLDTRVFRISPPSTVDWYDIDFPEVITARQQLLPDRANAHSVGADLTDPNWLERIPADRPAVIVADGLMAFLGPDDLVSLLRRLTSHFPTGELAFNGYTKYAIWAAKHAPGTKSVANLIKNPGFDDPHQPERWVPGLTLVKEILLTREPEIADYPPVLRRYYSLAARSTAWSRKGTTVLHYRF
jgi:O-methyltransferase involved in polyketide biosynthesis